MKLNDPYSTGQGQADLAAYAARRAEFGASEARRQQARYWRWLEENPEADFSDFEQIQDIELEKRLASIDL